MIAPLQKLHKLVSEKGTIRAAAESLGVTESYVHDLLKGKRGISDNIAHKLGFRKVITFEPLEGQL